MSAAAQAARALARRAAQARRQGRRLARRALVRAILARSPQAPPVAPVDYDALRAAVRMGDVLLVQAPHKLAYVMRATTHCAWTHCALAIGRLEEVPDPALRGMMRRRLPREVRADPLLLQCTIAGGVFVSPLRVWFDAQVLLCRPRAIDPADAWRAVRFGLLHAGGRYDARNVADMARFVMPWPWRRILPPRWRSTLFSAALERDRTRLTCTSIIARAFAHIGFPVMPLVAGRGEALRLVAGNTRMAAVQDFEASPYFDVLKFPLLAQEAIDCFGAPGGVVPAQAQWLVEKTARARADAYRRLQG